MEKNYSKNLCADVALAMLHQFGIRYGVLLGLFVAATLNQEAVHAEPKGTLTFETAIDHRDFEDFSGGRVADGGSNLYVTRSGTLQMIHRWDLNNDGHLDIFVGQDHNDVENVDLLIYWGHKSGPRSLLPDVPQHQPLDRLLRDVAARQKHATRLPSDGGGRSLLRDLNGDGYPEIVFCNYIHNYSINMKALIYWGGADGYLASRRTELPTLMAQGLTAADFNQDGFIDLAFANSGIEGGERFGYSQHLESYIYWNGPTGFDTDRRTAIATVSAVDCVSGDVTGDGFPELIFVNNNADQKDVYVYVGGPTGFTESKREIRRGGDPVGIQLADVTGEGLLDLVVAHRNNRAEIFLGSTTGLERQAWTELETNGAIDCQVSDLNRDGKPDLIFANVSGPDSYLYWGTLEGFTPHHRTPLPTLHSMSAAVADFNGDGWTDVAFANENDGKTHDVNSFIYWNGPAGFHAANRREVQGFGAVSVQAGDLDSDGNPELVLVNRSSGSFRPIDSFIYWGNSQNRYSTASMSLIPGTEKSVVAIADFNQDNWVDIAYPSGFIYWGGPEGYDSSRRVLVSEMEAGHGASTADLNRDGYLDLVVPRKHGYGGKASNTQPTSTGTILWGTAKGFDPTSRTELKLAAQSCQSATIADLNRDGFLDLMFPDADTENLEFYWGSPEGYGAAHHSLLKLHSTSHVEVADLNGDGWLDLLMGGIYDKHQFGRPMRVLSLLWGGPEGYSLDRCRQLEAFESEEQAVSDLNQDGFLDIVVTNYHADTTRSIPFYIYWGGPDGSYSESHRSSFPAESSAAVTVADLNKDRWADVVVFNHLDRGDHGAGAHIYWGSPDGLSVSRRDWLPTFGPHYGVRRDVGNIYDRRLQEHYVSDALALPKDREMGRLRWKAETSFGTAIRFQIRTAASKQQLNSAAWYGPDSTAATSFDQSDVQFKIPMTHQWCQYRISFLTPDAGSTAVLHEVAIDVKK